MSQFPYGPSDADPSAWGPQSSAGYGAPTPYDAPVPVDGGPAQSASSWAYGYPGAYGQPGGTYAPPPRTNGIAVASLVLGIVALGMSWIPFVNIVSIVLGIAAVVTGIVGITRARPPVSGKGQGIAGLIVGGVAIVVSAAVLIIFAVFVNAVSHSADRASGASSQEILANELRVEFGTFEGEADEYGLVDSSLPITITNTSDTTSYYSFTVEARDADGRLVDSDYVSAGSLRPGQSVTEEAFEWVEADDLDALHGASFEATDASAF